MPQFKIDDVNTFENICPERQLRKFFCQTYCITVTGTTQMQIVVPYTRVANSHN